MKKLFYIILVLLIASPVFAISIPSTEQVINDTGEEAVWLMSVHNNDAKALDVGDVVVWDIADSTGDNDYYVEKISEADTFLVAGIVYSEDIAIGGKGIIAVRGIVDVDVTGAINTGALLCTSDTTEAGFADECSDKDTDANAFGFALANTITGSVKAYVFGR